MYIVIVGGGHIGFHLSKHLKEDGHEVVILEKDKAHAAWMTTQLGEIVVHGDGCEARVLREVGVTRADVFVAVTGDDEDNLVACQTAKFYFMVKRTIARVVDPRHAALFERLGVDGTVSGTQLIYNIIDQEIETGKVIPIGALKKGNIEVVEVQISPLSPALGKKVRELELPAKAKALIVCVIREEQAALVTGDTEFHEGDIVVALVATDEEATLRDALAPSMDHAR